MKKTVRIFSFACIILFTAMVSLFLVFIYPHQPIAKILLYHSITNEERNRDSAIGVNQFKRQMDYLLGHGYEPVFLGTVIQKYKKEKAIPAKWIVLTFDGGYEDFFTNVYPLLKRYKFKATLFPVTSGIGQKGSVTWEQLQEMKDSGFVEIGSHSHGHLTPTCLSLAEAEKEKTLSKAILEKKLGVGIASYSYPYGAVNDQVKKLVQKAGYEGAVGIVYRLGEFKLKDIYNLRRIYVAEYAKIPLMFRFMLSGYYVPMRGLILRILNVKAPRDAVDCTDL